MALTHPTERTVPLLTMLGGRYRVLEKLGRGGTAVVYRVHDVGGNRELALKQLEVGAIGRHAQQAIALFEREYYVLAQLAHPRVITVYDYGLGPAGPFYTMELLDGGDLAELSPLPAPRACQLMLEVCSSLALLHSRRLVHRDVSPRNVRCSRDGHAKLIDFGAMTPHGQSDVVAGTPSFIAPEVLHKVSVDGRADLFSLGATLYFTLTGRPPFAARHLDDQREEYGREIVPPSQYAEGIPQGLDALCASLLRIDPSARPRSAFEVMHKLQALVVWHSDEPLDVSQAYLTTPLLCGREPQLRVFRQRIRSAHEGRGSALLFQSAAGLGRSRLLDACAIEAKTAGWTVLRASTGVASICAQVLQALPEAALVAAQRAGVSDSLFDGAGLRALDSGAIAHEQRQAALGTWLAQLCKEHPLLILVDDLERIDEPTLAWLASLVLAAPRLKLQLTAAVDGRPLDTGPLSIFARRCSIVTLAPLTAAETETLLASVFGRVPHLSMLTKRLYDVASGSPGATLLLAQHLVDSGVVTYRGGEWTLPAELGPEDLPESAREAVRARIVGLPRLAQRFAQIHALLETPCLSIRDYALLAPDASSAEIDAALLALLAAEVLSSEEDRYHLRHPAIADVLRKLPDEREQQALHLALANVYARSLGSNPYLRVRHLVGAGRYTEAFDVVAASSDWIEQQGEQAIKGVHAPAIALSLERMLERANELGRTPREAHELRRKLCAFAVVGDDALHARVAPVWLEQLVHDSGLALYRSLDSSVPAADRVMQALTATQERYQAMPPQTRVYGVQEALKHLALYVVTSIVVSVRTADMTLLQSLPELLEPFASLSPVLHAIWQNAAASVEAEVLGRRISSTRRLREVFASLGQLDPTELPYLTSIRLAVAHSIGVFEAYRGDPSAMEWAALLDDDRKLAVGAMQIRRAACLMRADMERAAKYEQEAELRSLRAEVRQMLDAYWTLEMEVSVLTNDLALIKRIFGAATQLSAKYPGWMPRMHVANGYMHLFAGDAEAALAAFDRATSHMPVQMGPWLHATAGAVTALSQLGRGTEAVQRGAAALRHCEALGVELGWHRIARSLALAEASLGQLAEATQRIESLIASEHTDGIHGLPRAATYEARAQIAICARDVATARRYALLAVEARGGESSPRAWERIAPLVDDARKQQLDLGIRLTALDRGDAANDRVAITEALRGCPDEAARAQRVLETLCGLAQAKQGHLFLANARGEITFRGAHPAGAASSDMIEFVRGYFAQQLDDAMLSELVSQLSDTDSPAHVATYYDPDGTDRQAIILSCDIEGQKSFAGVVLLAFKSTVAPSHSLRRVSNRLTAEVIAAGDACGVRART